MMNLDGRVAVITGAGSGIGRAIALCLARRGCHLALADIDEPGLAQTVTQAQSQVQANAQSQAKAQAAPPRVSAHLLDVANRDAVAALPAMVLQAQGRVDLLVNNAGVALAGNFELVSEADFEWLMEINFYGVVRMTRAFLPALRASDDACIVNISSVFGLISPPGQCAYSASKFAVRGFSNALRHELAGTHVGVSVVHPGGVSTNIARKARIAPDVPADELRHRLELAEQLLRMPPERAGEIIVRGVEKRRPRILVGRDALMISLLERLAPVGYWRVLAPRLRA
jgi:NAD(P)-dependent dehydrogenase (short-subunit alcohol dehydrogenase family)